MKFRLQGMSKLIDWPIRAIGVILVVFVVLIGLASTAWFRHVLEQRIQAGLEQATGGKVEIVGMTFHPLVLKVSARRLIVHGRENNSEQPFFSAQNVVVRISPSSLFRFRLLLRTLDWQQAEIRLVTYPDGSTNLPGAHATPESGQAFKSLMDLKIHRLTLAHTTLAWNNRLLSFQVAARNVALQLQLSRDHHYLGTVASSNTIFNWKSRTLPPLSFATTFQLSGNQVQVSSLSWQIENLRGQASGSFHWVPRLVGNFAFRSAGGLQQAARTLGITAVQRGYLFLEGKGVYDDAGLAVRGRVEARELELTLPRFKPGMVSLSSDYEFEGQLLKLTNVIFTGLEGRAQGKVTLSLRGSAPSLALIGQFENLRLQALLQAIPGTSSLIAIFHPGAQISGKARADWQQRSGLRGQFNLQCQPPPEAIPGTLPLSGRAQGSFVVGHEGLVNLQEAQISTPHSTLEAQGSFGTAQSSLAVKVVTSDFEEWRPLARILIETRKPLSLLLRSKATFAGSVSGTFSHPEIEGLLEAGTFDYGGWRWDGFHANIFGAPDRTSISSGRLKLGTSTLTFDAQASLDHWRLESKSLIHLKAAARETPVAGLRAALNLKPSMHGLLTGQVQVDGTMENLSATGEFTVHKGGLDGVPFDSLFAEVHASGSTWEVNKLKIIEGRGQASGQLRIDFVQRSFSAQLRGRGFPLDQLRFLNPQETDSKSGANLSGLVNFDLNGKGSFDNARAHSTLEISQLAWKGQTLGNVRGNADWEGHQIQLRIEGEGTPGRIQLTGSIDTRNEWPMQLSGQYVDFRLDPWIEQLSSHSLGAQMSASGSINVAGPLRQASRLTGSSRVTHLEISFPELKMTNENPIQVQYAGRWLKLDWFRMQGPATNLEVGGAIHFSHPPALDLTAKGTSAATLLSMMAPKIQATGGSTLEVHVGGTLAQPQLVGTVEINNVSLGYGNFPFRLSALNGKINLQGGRGVISSMKGTIGGGTVNFAGYAALRDVLRYEIRTTLSQVRVRYPSDFTTLLDGNLTLGGTSARGQLNGDITIRNIFASESLNFINLMAGNNKPLSNSSFGVALPFASKINLNVRVSSTRPVRLETRNLRLVSDIDTRLQGTLSNPVVVGNVYLRSGETIFRGNRYTLSRGEISMTNPFETEPVLDLQVNTRIDKYELTLELSGPPDRIRFSYRSDPPLPTEDILSLLAFGYSRRQEEFAPGGRNLASSMGASALLSQALSSQVTGRVQRLFGVSRVKLIPYSAELGTMGGPVLTIEQQISPQLTLTYETTTANSQYRVFEFEWAVSPRMAVRGFRDQNGIFGLELKFRKRFK